MEKKKEVNQNFQSLMKVFSLIMACIYVMYYYFNRGNISNIKTFLEPELNLNATQFSIISSAFSLTYGLFQPIGGFLMDKIGLKILCPLLLSIGSIAIYIFASFPDMNVAYYSRCLMGVCFCVASTGALKYFSIIWSNHYDFFSNFAAILMSLTAAVAASGSIKALMTYMGWRNFLQIMAISGIFISILLYISFAFVFAYVENEKKEEVKEKTSLLTGLKTIYSLKNVLPVTIFTVCISAAGYTIMDGWGDSLLFKIFPTLTTGTSLMPATLGSIGNALGFLFNIIIKNLCIRLQMLIYAIISLSALLSIIYLKLTYNMYLVCFFFLGFGCAAQNIGFSWLVKNLLKKYLGLGLGLLNCSCMYFGCALVQRSTGVILDFLKRRAIAGGLAYYDNYRAIDLINMFKFLMIPGIIALIAIFLICQDKEKKTSCYK
jgi:MFS family permease